MILPILYHFFNISQNLKAVIDVYFTYFPLTLNFVIFFFYLGSLRHQPTNEWGFKFFDV